MCVCVCVCVCDSHAQQPGYERFLAERWNVDWRLPMIDAYDARTSPDER